MPQAVELKPLNEQVMVITGASSGIGLVTARMAARRGACVLLTARNARDLETAVAAIRAEGGRAVQHVADVARPEEVEEIVAAALRAYGTIDTWVNNAGVALYGRVTDVALDDMRRQFDVNYWGQVYGSLAAVKYLAQGGALINVASALADRAIPLQANYCAAKHALKGFTDALRMELHEAGLPIAVTLVKPSSIDTPLFEKAKSYLGVEPRPVPPVYAPEAVARAILHAAEHPVRDIIVGGFGKVVRLADRAPALADRYMEGRTSRAQRTEQELNGRPDNLHGPVERDGGERGGTWRGRTLRRSWYTDAALHRRGLAVATALLGAVGWALRRRRPPRS